MATRTVTVIERSYGQRLANELPAVAGGDSDMIAGWNTVIYDVGPNMVLEWHGSPTTDDVIYALRTVSLT